MAKKQAKATNVKTPVVKKLQQRARFAAGTATLTVQLKEGRNGGFNVSVALRKKNEKTQTGARSAFSTFDDAVEQFTKLAEDARAQGWKSLSRNISGAGAFTTVPPADAGDKK